MRRQLGRAAQKVGIYKMEKSMSKIDVLPCVDGDPGFVRLVDHMGSDLSVVRSARVSYNADWRGEIDNETLQGKDEKLIKYLWKHKHTSPFEAVSFTFEVKAPIFVFRQWHRHRTWSYNEISGRYTELDDGFYVPNRDKITTQATHNKQVRTDDQVVGAAMIRDAMVAQNTEAFLLYKKLLDDGVAREIARSILPVSTYSRMFATVDLHNLFHFLNLRMHEHSQYEIRVYADAILELIKPIVSVAVAAFLEERNPK
jgi:thymidylate synthase (FAD)